jgi:hypothetical protein
MEKEQALEVLIQVANLAQAKGVFSLQEAVVVSQAIQILTPKNDETND